jgi:hypothetical protein
MTPFRAVIHGADVRKVSIEHTPTNVSSPFPETSKGSKDVNVLPIY